MMMMSLTTAPSTLENRVNRWLGAVGRLKPGVTTADAQRDLNGRGPSGSRVSGIEQGQRR
jgi:hypothetical protein